MKRIFLFLLAAAAFGGCRSHSFADAPAAGNAEPIVPARLQPGANRLFLTDYLPQWERADSVTSSELGIEPAADGWAEFVVTAPEGPFVATFEAWTGGHCLSVVALGGERVSDAWAFSEGCDGSRIQVKTSQAPRQVVALWQNCRLPDEYVSISD